MGGYGVRGKSQVGKPDDQSRGCLVMLGSSIMSDWSPSTGGNSTIKPLLSHGTEKKHEGHDMFTMCLCVSPDSNGYRAPKMKH